MPLGPSDPEMSPAVASGSSARLVDYVVESSNVHQLVSSVETFARDKHYVLVLDASIFCSFDRLAGAASGGGQAPHGLDAFKRQQVLNLRLFYNELLHLLESYDNVIVIPEVKGELANLIAAALGQIDRKKAQYNALTPARKDQVVDTWNQLLRIEELLRKLRVKIEERVLALPRTNAKIFAALEEAVVLAAETLGLKKSDVAGRSSTDERIAARAFHEVLVNHKKVAVCTRDEDVRRLVSTVYKLFVSSTVREEATRLVVRALHFQNIVVLKYNGERDVFSRFFESSTQPDIGEFIFSRWVPDRARTKLTAGVRSALAAMGKELEVEAAALDAGAGGHAASAIGRGGASAGAASEAVIAALAAVHERMLWYQEVARSVGVGDIHDEIRVLRSMFRVAEVVGHPPLLEAVQRDLQQLMKKRIHIRLRELDDKNERLNRDLHETTQSQRYRKDVAAAERLRELANEIADVAREKHFFEWALATERYALTQDDFRKSQELLDRFAANGYDMRDGECLVPPNEIADITGLDYHTVLKVLTELDVPHEAGCPKLTPAILLKFVR